MANGSDNDHNSGESSNKSRHTKKNNTSASKKVATTGRKRTRSLGGFPESNSKKKSTYTTNSSPDHPEKHYSTYANFLASRDPIRDDNLGDLFANIRQQERWSKNPGATISNLRNKQPARQSPEPSQLPDSESDMELEAAIRLSLTISKVVDPATVISGDDSPNVVFPLASTSAGVNQHQLEITQLTRQQLEARYLEQSRQLLALNNTISQHREQTRSLALMLSTVSEALRACFRDGFLELQQLKGFITETTSQFYDLLNSDDYFPGENIPQLATLLRTINSYVVTNTSDSLVGLSEKQERRQSQLQSILIAWQELPENLRELLVGSKIISLRDNEDIFSLETDVQIADIKTVPVLVQPTNGSSVTDSALMERTTTRSDKSPVNTGDHFQGSKGKATTTVAVLSSPTTTGDHLQGSKGKATTTVAVLSPPTTSGVSIPDVSRIESQTNDLTRKFNGGEGPSKQTTTADNVPFPTPNTSISKQDKAGVKKQLSGGESFSKGIMTLFTYAAGLPSQLGRKGPPSPPRLIRKTVKIEDTMFAPGDVIINDARAKDSADPVFIIDLTQSKDNEQSN